MAVPIKTILIVTIIGVTLLFDIVDIRKQRHETVSITILDIIKTKKNRHSTSSSAKNNNPLWKTAKSPYPSQSVLTNNE
tara:strand:- start:95 stop:331 length:237 start_codon:yes stop_codon:yes gene_type:complete